MEGTAGCIGRRASPSDARPAGIRLLTRGRIRNRPTRGSVRRVSSGQRWPSGCIRHLLRRLGGSTPGCQIPRSGCWARSLGRACTCSSISRRASGCGLPCHAGRQAESRRSRLRRPAENREETLDRGFRELSEIDLLPALAQITAPTVVFAPSRDWFVRREAPHVAAAIPGARLTLIPHAGHLWTQRHPMPLYECVRALSSAAPSSVLNAP